MSKPGHMPGSALALSMGRNRGVNRGVALPTALVFLTVLALGAGLALHTTWWAARTSASAADKTQALHVAEAGLLWCEQQLLAQARMGQTDTPGLVVQPVSAGAPADPQAWALEAHWSDTTQINEVPDAVINSDAGLQARYNKLPQCMIEEALLPRRQGGDPGQKAYVLTVRGYSPSYAEVLGWGTGGAMMKLQSVLVFTPQ